MARGPIGNSRLTSTGPLAYDEESPPELPRAFEPPKVTDHRGNSDYWTPFIEGRDVPTDEVPTSLRGVTGVYIPEQNWAIVDDRIEVHHTVQLDRSLDSSNPVPSFKENDVIPFATDYVGNKGENVIGLQGRFDLEREVEYWKSFASIPEGGSLLDHDEPDVDVVEPDVTDVYKMVWPLKVLGVEPETLAVVKHTIRRVGEAERKVYMEELYRELQFEGLLPEQRMNRTNNIRRPEK